MQTIQKWFAKYSVWTHLVAFAAFLVGAFNYLPQFHALVLQVYGLIPGYAQSAVLTGIALYAWYRKGEPTSGPPISSSSTLPVLMLCALLVTGTLPMAGCSGATVAQDIVNWTPALQGAVATVDTTASLLAPLDAPIFAAATVGFDAASNALVTQAKAYLANPSAGVLATIQSQIVTFQQQVNASLLTAAKITDSASQKHALAAIQGVATIVSAMLALVQSISSKAAVAQMAHDSPIKLAAVKPYLDADRAVELVAAHYQEPASFAALQVANGWGNLYLAGF
jgi:hypothetical protein